MQDTLIVILFSTQFIGGVIFIKFLISKNTKSSLEEDLD
jgi:hypothetical protein